MGLDTDKNIVDKVIKTEKVEWASFHFLQKSTFKDFTDEQMQKLKTSIVNNDFIETFKVWQNGSHIYCLDGFHRCKALNALAEDGYNIPELMTAAFIECKDKKDAAKKVLVYSSQYAAITGQGLKEFAADFDLVFDEYKLEIDIPQIDLDKIQSQWAKDENRSEAEDDIPEPPKEPMAKKGDLYLLGGTHRLLCGDATSKSDVDNLMHGEKADMVFTDPPYNALMSWNKKKGETATRLNPVSWFDNDDMEWDDYRKFLQDAFKGLTGHSVYVCSDYRIYPLLCELLKAAVYNLKHCIVWKKNVWGLGKRYRFQHEFIVYGCIDDAPFYGDRAQSDVWEVGIDRVAEHNTPKPVELPRIAMLNSSKAGDIILDLFGGSGSTMIACEQAGRQCYMMEIEPIYIDVIIERYKNFTGKDVEIIGSKEDGYGYGY